MLLLPGELLNTLPGFLPFSPTSGQQRAMEELDVFFSSSAHFNAFLLTGYAGTGKTSLIGALVKALPELNIQTVLLAPTGRAAKVLGSYAGKQAFTIHKQIYYIQSGSDGSMRLSLQANKHLRTLFIVDEASMISPGKNTNNDAQWGENNLLDDLVNYVYSGKQCALLLLGDTAQLPPVGENYSPALDPAVLENSYRFSLFTCELKEVVRQPKASGVLVNATGLRKHITEEKYQTKAFTFSLQGFTDVCRVEGNELQEKLSEAYDKYGQDEVIVVCRSNKRANLYNAQIRNRIRWVEDELAAGDLLMAVKNNYFWLPPDSKAGFIANGDMLEILKIKRYTDMHGFRFADCVLRMIDYPDEPELEIKILINTLHSNSPALLREESNQLYQSVAADYAEIPNKRKKREAIRKDPYYQALQVKFGYAVTCHKAQGGQWKAVFVDQGLFAENTPDTAYYRWLYTAVTRASEVVYLNGFQDDFFTP